MSNVISLDWAATCLLLIPYPLLKIRHYWCSLQESGQTSLVGELEVTKTITRLQKEVKVLKSGLNTIIQAFTSVDDPTLETSHIKKPSETNENSPVSYLRHGLSIVNMYYRAVLVVNCI